MTPTEQDKELREQLKTYNWSSDKDYQIACIAFKDITADRKRVALEIKDKGHWYAGTYGKDSNGFEVGHMCSCGISYKSRESIDGHVTWKLAELKAQQEEVK